MPGGTSAAANPPIATGGAAPTGEAASLNLALLLEYLGAQYYSYAASGAGLPLALTGGLGRQGSTTGGRKASLSDPLLAQQAAEIAADKRASVTLLRDQLGGAAAAQPTVDFSNGPGGAFSLAAQAAGIVGAGAAFDPFASDDAFLLGALLIENGVAAAYRGALPSVEAAGALQAMTDNLAAAIYHGGLVRSLLSAGAADNPSIVLSVNALGAYMAKLDGSDAGDQTLAGASGFSANVTDGDGHPVPFTRASAQALRLVYLGGSTAAAGGLLPEGTSIGI